jgi:hypothetical protein
MNRGRQREAVRPSVTNSVVDSEATRVTQQRLFRVLDLITHMRDPLTFSPLDRRKDVHFSRSISSASGKSLTLRGQGKSPVAVIPHTCGCFEMMVRLFCAIHGAIWR